MNLEMTTRNLNHGSALSVCIETTPPKGIYSVASLPRMNLNGQMVKLEDKEDVCSLLLYNTQPHCCGTCANGQGQKALDCFLSRHPDAHEWTPDNPDAPHSASWYQFKVESVYYFGGFGNVSYIGFLPIDLYRSVDLSSNWKMEVQGQ